MYQDNKEKQRKCCNFEMQIVYVVFTPALMFASLAKTVTLQDIISWLAIFNFDAYRIS